MSRSSACRGQVEPLAALVAVVAVGIGLSVYTGALGAALPANQDGTARPTAERVERAVTVDGVVDPDRLAAGRAVVPADHEANVTLTAGTQEWHVGPRPPATARTSRLRVSVRTDPGVNRPGRLTVRVWT